MHKAGFVSIVGFPNSGKSTLLNSILGEKLVIVSPKVQTTRQRIFGIYNEDDLQIVFSDTPGFIENTHYELHKSMNNFVSSSFVDSDVLIYITEPNVRDLAIFAEKLNKISCPLIVLINKADLSNVDELNRYAEFLHTKLNISRLITISALHNFGVSNIVPIIKEYLPVHEPYFPKDELSDRNLRFFVAEIIREHLLLLYQKEIPYASEVLIENFKKEENITRIEAIIYVEKETQKMIILGKGGLAIKKLGTQSRLAIEKFIGARVFLDLKVKVLKNWRNDKEILKKMGYQS